MDVNLTIAGDISVLRLMPNDALVVKVSRRVSNDVAQRIIDAIRQRLGDTSLKVLVLDEDLDIEVARSESA